MASSREYRDYTLGWDSLRQLPARTPSVSRNRTSQSGVPRAIIPDIMPSGETRASAPSSPRTIIPDINLNGETHGTPSPEHRSTAVAEEASEGSTASSHDGDDYATGEEYATGTAQTTEDDDDDNTSRDSVPPQSVLHDGHPDVSERPGTRNLHSAVRSISTDANQKARFTPSLRSMSEVSQHPVDSIAGTLPSPIKQSLRPTPTRSMSEVSRSGLATARSSTSRMPEFFSQAVFQTVLLNPTISHQLLKYAQSRLCGENMEFLARVSRYNALLEEVSKSIFEIHKEFIANSAQTQINLAEQLLMRVNTEMRSALSSTVPALGTIFSDAQGDIERLVYTDVYPNFVRQQMSVSAAKALGSDRSRYAGLGDCFVLTDPAKADNPIVYASDGFVKVTGYQRNEIIPRNCRFLQCQTTDRAAVRRIKTAIDQRKESVELILNQKKNGEPFWNLLYCAPLYDAYGKLVFFLGGQINCSTTVHNASDVLRILSQSKETEEEAPVFTPQLVKPPRTRTSFLNAFRSRQFPISPREPGMEGNLVGQIGDLPLKNQMDTFYTAYSNYIIINYSSFLITFISGGIVDLLFPIKAKSAYHAQAVGNDIFKFLGNHGSGSVGSEFKTAVRGALAAGRPISLDLKLCARPYMGFERFVLHWTPLKDGSGAVAWAVLTLGNEQRA